MISKIKEFVKIQLSWVKTREGEIILAVGVILVSLISFAAGYLVAQEQLKTPIQIEDSSEY